MRHTKLLLAVALAAVFLAAAGTALAANPPGIAWWVTAGGGGPASGANVTINSSLGQPVIGPSSRGNLVLGAGYWYGVTNEVEIFLPLIKR